MGQGVLVVDMEAYKLTIEVTAKVGDAMSYVDEFYSLAEDEQMAKYEYHKFTHENHADVESAEESHTLHINGVFPQVQRLLSVEKVDAPEADVLPVDYI
jgi:hypothetical protein